MSRLVPATLLLAALAAGDAFAGATTPRLALSAAAGSAAGAARSVVVEGNLDFGNALQVGYPIDLLVFQGATFARFPFAGAPIAGTSPELADGALAPTEIAALLAEGAAPPAGVRIVTLVPTSIRVTLPAAFTAGPATAIVFGILTDGTVLSNPITFTLP